MEDEQLGARLTQNSSKEGIYTPTIDKNLGEAAVEFRCIDMPQRWSLWNSSGEVLRLFLHRIATPHTLSPDLMYHSDGCPSIP